MHYLHLQVAAGLIGTSGGESTVGSHYEKVLGSLKATQPAGCGFTGSHLHQSGNTAAWTAIWHNGSVDPPPDWDHKFVQ
jgi:hypothetical protein